MTDQIERKAALDAALNKAFTINRLAAELGYTYTAICTAKSPSGKVTDQMYSYIQEYLRNGEVLNKREPIKSGNSGHRFGNPSAAATDRIANRIKVLRDIIDNEMARAAIRVDNAKNELAELHAKARDVAMAEMEEKLKAMGLPVKTKRAVAKTLTDEQRREVLASDEPATVIARRFGVSDSQIKRLRQSVKK